MDSNTHSTRSAGGLRAVVAELNELVAPDPDRLTAGARAARVLGLRRLLDQLEGHWLGELADIDAGGAAGAEEGLQAPSTAGWLRARLRLGAGAASTAVRTARALFRGPLAGTAQALVEGEISVAHAAVLAAGTHDLDAPTTTKAEPVLVAAARRLDPPRLRRVMAHLQQVADPDGADRQAERRHGRRGLWLAPTFEGMVAVNGLLEAEAGQTLLAALEPLARPTSAADERSGAQRQADALAEVARRQLEGGRLPQSGGVRPQLLVTVDLDTLLGRASVGGEVGGIGPLDPEACRRLACDSAVTRVLVTRQRSDQHGPDHHIGQHGPHHRPRGTEGSGAADAAESGWPAGPSDLPQDLATRLGAAAALLPPVLGGAPTQPLEVGRASRVVQAAQRAALVVRDGGCGFPGCDRPQAWCEAHHLQHWLHGGPTDLSNLALLCRAHHRAVHEGGWRLARDPDGRLAATPPQRRPRSRRPHTAA
jgi:Domain of unknown function (DUF222)/HNH endonuclease